MKVQFRIDSGPLEGKEFNFDEPAVFLFGRSPDCQCCVPNDPCVSRHHFMIEVFPPECRIRDLGSLNGTFVNDVKYGGRQKNEKPKEVADRAAVINVKNGDRIRVGQTELSILIELAQAVEVPAICFKCGRNIEASKKEALAYAKGVFLCTDCRNNLSPAPSPRKDDKNGRVEDLLGGLIDEVYGEERQGLPEIPGYVVVMEIGRGGYGQVYFVKRLSDGKELALKVMWLQKKTVNQKDILHFQREMKVCMKLKHPNIVTFEEQGYAKGLFYFTMEYCRGGSVENLLDAKGVLNPEEALPIMLQTLEGLSYAHENGFVHRDLKPGNILFPDRDHTIAKISDFGMAKNFQQAGLSGFTATGEYAGTPQFMPKEQLLDFKNSKPVSDIFSIGATFYFMLTSNIVYDFQSVTDPVRAILEDKIIPISQRRDLPEKLSDAINKAISPQPENRFQTAAEMRNALLEISDKR